MNTKYEDWADWAGDHPQQAEEDLRKEREKAVAATYAYWAEQGANPEEFSCANIEGYTTEPCEHDNPDNDYECVDCGARIEGWEPTDAQIFAHYGQTKETAA